MSQDECSVYEWLDRMGSEGGAFNESGRNQIEVLRMAVNASAKLNVNQRHIVESELQDLLHTEVSGTVLTVKDALRLATYINSCRG